MHYFVSIPNSSIEIGPEEFIKCVAGYLPDSWIIDFSPEETIAHVRLLHPVKKTVGIGEKRSYRSAMTIARNLRIAVR